MDAKLVVVGGKANKDEVALKLPTVIGRSRDADLTMAHPMVSRQHCEIFEVDGLLKIRDLGSLNGTFVGENQVSEAELRPNAQFTIGPLTFRVVYEYAGKNAAPAATTPESPSEEPAEVEFFDELADLEELAEESGAEEPAFDTDEAESVPAAEQPEIATPEGELPDFAAWADDDTGEPQQDTKVEAAAALEGGSKKKQRPTKGPPQARTNLSAPPLAPPSPDTPTTFTEEPTVEFDSAESQAPNKAGKGPQPAGEADLSFAEDAAEPAPAADESDDVDFLPDLSEADSENTSAEDDDLDEFLKGLE